MKRKKDRTEDFLKAELILLQESGLGINLEISETPSKIAADRNCLVSAKVVVNIATREIQFEVGLDSKFPHSLPIIFVNSDDFYGYIPHIETDGYVCYTSKENLVLNYKFPQQILEEAIGRAIRVLETGINKENVADFIDDFDAHWRRFKNAIAINAYITPNATLRKITVSLTKENNRDHSASFACDDDSIITDYWHKSSGLSSRNGLYIPLLKAINIDLFQKDALTITNLRRAILPNLSSTNKKLLKRATKKWGAEEIVVFMMPRPSGGEVLFGVCFKGVRSAYPLDEKGEVDEIIPLMMDRHDAAYLLPRGGANEFLRHKKVALIGCGAVGGNMAVELVQSGLLNITLLDNDVFNPENIFRHTLGKKNENLPKADALKLELERRFPYVKVKSYLLSLEDAVSKSIFDFEQYDLILLAIGDDNTSLLFNELVYARNKGPAIIYSWLEPYGIGGHVLITNNQSKKGCFECLFTSTGFITNDEFNNRASLVEPGQSFSKDISGCANLFVPFSALDASTTATLAVRIALKVLLEEIDGNLLYSWKGDDIDLLKAGFSTSSRYRNSNLADLAKGIAVYNDLCKVCGDSHNE